MQLLTRIKFDSRFNDSKGSTINSSSHDNNKVRNHKNTVTLHDRASQSVCILYVYVRCIIHNVIRPLVRKIIVEGANRYFLT